MGKGVNGGQGHAELFLHLLCAIPFGDVRVWGFLCEVSVYMFLDPIGFASVEGTWDAVFLGNGEYPRFMDMVFLFYFDGSVEVGNGSFFFCRSVKLRWSIEQFVNILFLQKIFEAQSNDL